MTKRKAKEKITAKVKVVMLDDDDDDDDDGDDGGRPIFQISKFQPMDVVG